MTKDPGSERVRGESGGSKDFLMKGCLSWRRGETGFIGCEGTSVKRCSMDQTCPVEESAAQSRNRKSGQSPESHREGGMEWRAAASGHFAMERGWVLS